MVSHIYITMQEEAGRQIYDVLLVTMGTLRVQVFYPMIPIMCDVLRGGRKYTYIHSCVRLCYQVTIIIFQHSPHSSNVLYSLETVNSTSVRK